MKKRIIKSIVLTVIFILAVIGFSAYMNQGDTDMTADMDMATLPTLSFSYGGREVNPVVGHKEEMNVSSVRDDILPYTGSVSGSLNLYEAVVTSAKFDVFTLDGTEVLASDVLEIAEDTFVISMGEILEKGKEALLRITLTLEGDEPVYYYTRVVNEGDFYVKDNMNYVMELHEGILSKKETPAIKRGMEPNGEGDNTTLQHVTIHSDMKHVLWGDLVPEVVNKMTVEIKETNDAYTAIQLSYRVALSGDNNDEEEYNVKEFFKVSSKDGKNYLLAYDRTATEIFNSYNVVLSSKGIILGMTGEEIPYKSNKEGTIASFVVERELWSYNKAEDEFSKVFSFASSANNDPRNYHDQHAVRILSMEENGNMTFSVYGYMNRGEHEGESGLAIYYYNMGTNSIEEKAFIKRADSYLVIDEELNKLAYYNAEQDILYILVEEDLYKINFVEDTQEILVENLQKEQYVTSNEGNMIAFQSEEDNTVSVWNFATDKQLTVKIESEDKIIPLGFVGEDFVYGIANPEDEGTDPSGQWVNAMHTLEIRNAKNVVVKSYEIEGIYILNAEVEGNMITLSRGKKNGSAYTAVSDDYITNNEESGGSISLKSYWTEKKETQYRLLFDEMISDTSAKTLEPKFTLYESLLTFESKTSESDKYFFVYGYGEQVGRFTNAADAIEYADEISGVVISPQQRYVWEDGNRVAWYRNFNIGRFVAESGETTLDACVKRVLRYENAEAIDVPTAMKEMSPEAIISQYTTGEGIRFRGSSCKDMFYLIDKGTPVIALTDSSNGVLLIGYDALNVTYVDVASGSIKSCSIEKMNSMTAGSGYTYIGYVK